MNIKTNKKIIHLTHGLMALSAENNIEEVAKINYK